MSNTVRLDDGHSTIFSFSEAPTIKLYEKEITPPGMTAGGPIDTTTMRNHRWRTFAPKKLLSLTAMSCTVAYATDAIPILFDMIGVKQEITVIWPDGATVTFWGWIEEFTPGSNVEGEQPTASLTITPSNVDADGVEVEPVYNYDSSESGGTTPPP